MTDQDPIVFIVDDDEAVCDSLQLLLRTVGVTTRAFHSAQEFLDAYTDDRPGCLLLDLRMPGMSGLELQERLHQMGALLPVIFVSGHGSVESAVHAMRAGAIDFLQKPFDDQEILDVIQRTLERDARARNSLAERDEIATRYARLTPREREVMGRVVQGQANKVIAIELGVSERTVEIHRGRVMQKMEADSLPHLVRMSINRGPSEDDT